MNYQHWLFMQEEPGWDFGPTGRTPEPKEEQKFDNTHYRPLTTSYEEQLRIEDEIIARHIAEHESNT